MSKRLKIILVVAAALSALLVAGAAIAGPALDDDEAGGGTEARDDAGEDARDAGEDARGDDDDPGEPSGQVSAADADRARDAASKAAGGTASEVERTAEAGGGYKVEVKGSDGKVEVVLDRDFKAVSTESDEDRD
jgi:hypothetical protein